MAAIKLAQKLEIHTVLQRPPESNISDTALGSSSLLEVSLLKACVRVSNLYSRSYYKSDTSMLITN